MDSDKNIFDILKNSLNKKLLYVVLILILIPLVLLVFSKFTPKNRFISDLNKIEDEITKCNLSLKDGISDKTIDTSKSKDLLTKGILSLDSIKDSLTSIESNEKYDDIKSTFKKALDYNISLYEVSLSILNDPSSKMLESKYSSLNNTIKLFEECSKSLASSGVEYTLDESSLSFFINLKNYTNALLKLNMQSDIMDEQRRDFLIEMDKFVSSFDVLSKSLKPSIDSIKKDNRSLSTIVDDISSKKSTFSSLEKQSTSLSIPSIGKEVYSSLEETLKLYSLYINELEHIVLEDKNSTDDSNSKEIQSKYDSAYSKYDDFMSSLNRFKEHTSSLKK